MMGWAEGVLLGDCGREALPGMPVVWDRTALLRVPDGVEAPAENRGRGEPGGAWSTVLLSPLLAEALRLLGGWECSDPRMALSCALPLLLLMTVLPLAGAASVAGGGKGGNGWGWEPVVGVLGAEDEELPVLLLALVLLLARPGGWDEPAWRGGELGPAVARVEVGPAGRTGGGVGQGKGPCGPTRSDNFIS